MRQNATLLKTGVNLRIGSHEDVREIWKQEEEEEAFYMLLMHIYTVYDSLAHDYVVGAAAMLLLFTCKVPRKGTTACAIQDALAKALHIVPRQQRSLQTPRRKAVQRRQARGVALGNTLP